MAIDAKCSFLNQMEKRLSSEVTADAMSRVLSIISDVMAGFDFREYAPMNTEPDDLLECFIDAMRVQGRSELTIERYQYIIGRLNKYVKVPARMVTVHHLRTYLASEKARGVADSTLEGLRQVFSSYFGWLFRESLIERNPAANLGAIKVPKKQKEVFTDSDIEKLKSGSHSIRDKAIIMFLAATGCRISEITGMDREQVNFNSLRCKVHGKGNKERTAYFDNATGFVLKTYLNSRTDRNPSLFVNRDGQRIRPDGVRAMLKKLAAEVGVEHVHPHKFRRTLATNLSRHGMGIEQICKILGHEKIDTSMTYVVLDEDSTNHSYRKYA